MTRCDVCGRPATFTLTAAYPAPAVVGELEVHPHFATYPMPLARTCAAHLVTAAARDASHPGATPAYLLRSITPQEG